MRETFHLDHTFVRDDKAFRVHVGGKLTLMTPLMKQCLLAVVNMSGFLLSVIRTRRSLVAILGLSMVVALIDL